MLPLSLDTRQSTLQAQLHSYLDRFNQQWFNALYCFVSLCKERYQLCYKEAILPQLYINNFCLYKK